VPGTLAVALSCVALSAVPTTIEAGVAQVMVGVVLVVVVVPDELLPEPHPAIASTAAKRATLLENEKIDECTLSLHARLNRDTSTRVILFNEEGKS
jgi:hypothetical protein